MSALEIHGWIAQPRSVSTFLGDTTKLKGPKPQRVDSIPLPTTPLANAVLDYAKKELREETFNHSMRVYYYGRAIQNHLTPTHPLPVSAETYLLTCLLHDIGTTDKNITATLMSFEFYGGYLALDLLKSVLHAPASQAESVTEAIIRHQDLGESGKISSLGLLIQLATIFGESITYLPVVREYEEPGLTSCWRVVKDNMGGNAELVHKETIEDVVGHYPRKKWSSCFAATIRKENGLKPWAHTTALGEEEFPGGVENNELMAPYDG